jgi:sec-independent protein translocase protein TatA
MFDLSPIQLVLVLVIALFAIGPKRLPEVGRTIGRTMRELRGAISLDAEHEGSDPEERTPARGAATTSEVMAEPARPAAVGGEEASAASVALTEEADPPDGGARVTGDPPSEGAPSADDMVVRGGRKR